jgi:hypothetical protein
MSLSRLQVVALVSLTTFCTALVWPRIALAASAAPAAAEAEGSEGPPPWAEGAGSGGATLRLRATQPDATYLLKVGRQDLLPRFMITIGRPPISQITIHTYQPLCAAPCDVTLPPGDYIFGMTQGDSRILDSKRLTLRGGETLTGTWVSRRAVRLLMAYSGLAAMLGGFIVAIKRGQECVAGSCSTTHPHAWLGLGIAVGGAGLMVLSQYQVDRAEIEVTP